MLLLLLFVAYVAVAIVLLDLHILWLARETSRARLQLLVVIQKDLTFFLPPWWLVDSLLRLRPMICLSRALPTMYVWYL